MNKNWMEGNWDQVKGAIQEQWGKLTNNDMDVLEGNRKQLAGKIQERYGIAQDEAEKQIEEWNNNNNRAA